MCSCRVQAHPRATRYIDNTHGRAKRRTAGEEKEDEREREGRAWKTHTRGDRERKMEKSGWLPVAGRETGRAEGRGGWRGFASVS